MLRKRADDFSRHLSLYFLANLAILFYLVCYFNLFVCLIMLTRIMNIQASPSLSFVSAGYRRRSRVARELLTSALVAIRRRSRLIPRARAPPPSSSLPPRARSYRAGAPRPSDSLALAKGVGRPFACGGGDDCGGGSGRLAPRVKSN